MRSKRDALGASNGVPETKNTTALTSPRLRRALISLPRSTGDSLPALDMAYQFLSHPVPLHDIHSEKFVRVSESYHKMISLYLGLQALHRVCISRWLRERVFLSLSIIALGPEQLLREMFLIYCMATIAIANAGK